MGRITATLAALLTAAVAALVPLITASPASACTLSTPFSHGGTYAQVYVHSGCGRYYRVKASFADGHVSTGTWRLGPDTYSVGYDANGGLRLAWKQWKLGKNGTIHSILKFG